MLKQIRYLIFISMFSTLSAACGGGGDSTSQVSARLGITASPLNIMLAEDTSATFTARLITEPVNDVTINISSNDVSGAEVNPPVLNFTDSAGEAPWNIPQTVTVSGIQDSVIDGNQNILIVLETGDSIDEVYRALPQTTIGVTVSDVDTAGFTVTGSNLNTTESGISDAYTIALNTVPDGEVVIDIISMDITEGAASVASLTFGIINWSVAQTVTVVPVDDNEIDGSQTYNIVMNINSDSTTDTTSYAVLALAPVSVTNIDEDNMLTLCPIGKQCCDLRGSECYACISINSACP